MIGLGLVSYGRPHYRERTAAAVHRHLSDVVDVFTTAIDVAPVAKAKNQVLRTLLDSGCSWLFVIEDDIIVESEQAVIGYIDAAENSGIDHLSFHKHGPACDKPRSIGPYVTTWGNMIGAYCLYSRASLETCGLLDENMFNAFEHCEHTQRLAAAGFTTPWPDCADATGSEGWLTEIPGSIENSSIRHTPEWQQGMNDAKAHWKETQPATFALVFDS